MNQRSCKGIIEEVEYPDKEHDIILVCQLNNNKRLRLSVTKDWIKKMYIDGQFQSGRDTIDIPLGSVERNGSVTSPIGKDFSLKKNLQDAKRILPVTIGTRRILAVRVISLDVKTTISMDQIRNNIFGDENRNGLVSLRSQFLHCSHGKLIFEPALPRNSIKDGSYGILNGVTQVTITENTYGVDFRKVFEWAKAALQDQFDVNADNLADHVMFCFPPGTTLEAAFAGINTWYSAYNNEACTYLSVQLHEIGHNLGLAHSGQNSDVYSDISGMMGGSFASDNFPRMCFNGAKNWQLGWYDDKKLSVVPALGVKTTHSLVGMVDYSNNPDGHLIILMIKNSHTSTDYYVSFNHKKSFNEDTMEGGNQVLVVGKGSENSESSLKAKLYSGDVYTIPNFNDSGSNLTITVIKIKTHKNPGTAMVSLCLGHCPVSPSNTLANQSLSTSITHFAGISKCGHIKTKDECNKQKCCTWKRKARQKQKRKTERKGRRIRCTVKRIEKCNNQN